MQFIDFFSGIGGFHSGLEKAGMKCVGWCEFDKFAQASYRAMYDTADLWFGDDIQKVKGHELPKADLWTFGFPCQDVSVAGKQKGIKKGTRSGLFYEVMRLLDECEENRPQWLVCENVKNLLSIDNGRGFLNVISEMAERGYSCEWKVYNSKDYGVPQNRERVYIVGYHGELGRREVLPKRRKNESAIKSFIPGRQGENIIESAGIARTLTRGGQDLVVSFVDLSNQETRLTESARALLARYHKGIPSRTAECSGVLQYGTPTRIRRLTPRECFRLQGFSDLQFDKAQAVNSDTQLYKQAGNAVTVNVVEEIGRHIMCFNSIYGGGDT